MASSIWRRLVIRPFMPYVNAYRRSKASAARRLVRACCRSAMRWWASARLRAWTDFVLTVQNYHASRYRKAGSWLPLLLDGAVGSESSSGGCSNLGSRSSLPSAGLDSLLRVLLVSLVSGCTRTGINPLKLGDDHIEVVLLSTCLENILQL